MGTSELEQKIKKLERKLCCKTGYYDTFNDFPIEGENNVLYIDKRTGSIFIWNGSSYIYNDDIISSQNTLTVIVNPLTGSDTRSQSDYFSGQTFLTLTKALQFANRSSRSEINVVLQNTSDANPAILMNPDGTQGIINKYITIGSGTIQVNNTSSFQRCFLTCTNTKFIINTISQPLSNIDSFFKFSSVTFDSLIANTEYFVSVGKSVYAFNSCTINFRQNNQRFIINYYAPSTVSFFGPSTFNDNGFTNLMLLYGDGVNNTQPSSLAIRDNVIFPAWLDISKFFYISVSKNGGPTRFHIGIDNWDNSYANSNATTVYDVAKPFLLPNLQVYADDTSAGVGGVVSGEIYKTPTGELRIKL